MMRIVHLGKGLTAQREEGAYADASLARPRFPQRARRLTGMPYRLKDFKPIPTSGNGYKPGQLLDLGLDQCRYELTTGLMCGARAKGSWCDEHDNVVHVRCR